MKLIAKTEGPKYNGSDQGCLTIGKEYEVLNIFQHINGNWIEIDIKINPRKYTFLIEVIDDNGEKHSIWNDYFYSTEELKRIIFK